MAVIQKKDPVMNEALEHIRKQLRERSGRKMEMQSQPPANPLQEPSIAEAIGHKEHESAPVASETRQPAGEDGKGEQGEASGTGKQVPTVDLTGAQEKHAGINEGDFHKKVTEAAIRAMIHGR